MCDEFDAKEPEIHVVTATESQDPVDFATACFAALLEKHGYRILYCDKFKGCGLIKTVAPCHMELVFSICPEAKTIRIMHRWPLDDTVGCANGGLNRAIEKANADSWWHNYSLDKKDRAAVVSSYITISRQCGAQEIMEFIDRQLSAFFEECETTELEKYLDCKAKHT